MSDHPVLIPTSEGAVGAVISEPRGKPRAAVVLLTAYGRPARSGVNSFWTHLARSLTELGLVVLRMDYSREGETLPIGEGVSGQVPKRNLDRDLVRQVIPWFQRRLGALELILIGVCTGGRGVLDYGGRTPDAIARSFLIVPHLRALDEGESRDDVRRQGHDDPDAVGADVITSLRAMLAHAPSWMLVGEHDSQDISLLRQLLGPTMHELEIDVVPDVALHFLDQPHLQAIARRWLMARISEALGPAVDSPELHASA